MMEKVNKLLAEYQEKLDALEKAAGCQGLPVEDEEKIREANDRGTIRLHAEMQTVLGVITLEVLLGIQVEVQRQTKEAAQVRAAAQDLHGRMGNLTREVEQLRERIFPLLDKLAGCVRKDGSAIKVSG